MKKFTFLLLLAFTFGISSFDIHAQQIIKHTVAEGETIAQIAQKYKVTPYDIYRLNPDAQNGIRPNTILLIPERSKPSTEKQVPEKTSNTPKQAFQSKFVNYEVQLQDTMYGLSKKYAVSIEELIQANPELKDGQLKAGMVIKIPTAQPEEYTPQPEGAVYHLVQPKETKFGIAKKYNTTVQALETLNPEIKESLPEGYNLLISKETSTTAMPEKSAFSESVSAKAVAQDTLYYLVKPKETMYGLSKMFQVSQETLLQFNPALAQGVQDGMMIKLPKQLMHSNISKGKVVDLTKTLYTSAPKNLAILLPFNVSRIDNDTTTSIQSRLKKDSFLNMTLDYYSGVMMAIDSAKSLGLNVKVSIHDSQETKNSSAINTLSQHPSLIQADAIIGPFYPQNVELLASKMLSHQVPVISPLRETTKSYSNLYQSMPSSIQTRNTVMQYLRAQNANVMAVVHAKKNATRQFLQQNHPFVHIVPLDEEGKIQKPAFQQMISNAQMNYVIIESETVAMLVNALDLLKTHKDNVTLIVFDINNNALDFEDVFKRMMYFKTIFPAVARINETEATVAFAEAYRKLNRMSPNQFAVRGFDLTFDTLLRLSQDDSFENTCQKATSYVESRFDYNKQFHGGYQNTGVYLFYYDADMNIQEIQH